MALLSADYSCHPAVFAYFLRPAEPPADFQGEFGLVHRVEVQAGGAAGEQAFAQAGDEVEAESADGRRVVAEAFESPPHPAQQLRAAGAEMQAQRLGRAKACKQGRKHKMPGGPRK